MLTHEKLHKLLVEELAREDLPPTKNILRIASIGMWVMASHLKQIDPVYGVEKSWFEDDETGRRMLWGYEDVDSLLSQLQSNAEAMVETYIADHIDHD